jgi:hypothetical protein
MSSSSYLDPPKDNEVYGMVRSGKKISMGSREKSFKDKLGSGYVLTRRRIHLFVF